MLPSDKTQNVIYLIISFNKKKSQIKAFIKQNLNISLIDYFEVSNENLIRDTL